MLPTEASCNPDSFLCNFSELPPVGAISYNEAYKDRLSRPLGILSNCLNQIDLSLASSED